MEVVNEEKPKESPTAALARYRQALGVAQQKIAFHQQKHAEAMQEAFRLQGAILALTPFEEKAAAPILPAQQE